MSLSNGALNSAYPAQYEKLSTVLRVVQGFANNRHADAARLREPIHASTADGIERSQLTEFTRALEQHTGRKFDSYQALHEFSVEGFRTFWCFFAQWAQPGFHFSGNMAPVCIGDDCEHARFFPDLRLNYAQSLLNLSVAPAHAPALTACHADGRRVRLTRGELRERVESLARALTGAGLAEGDHVVGVMRNDEKAVIAALAVTAVGATFSTAAPEMGCEAIVDRFAPLAPRMLIAHTAARNFDAGISLAGNVAGIAAALPSLQLIIRLDEGELPQTVTQAVRTVDELMNTSLTSLAGKAGQFAWRRFPFNHPLFIMFSSGTTGRPKCIVHGAGGSLIEHLKEHRLHTDLRPGERMYFHTSCAWMMWNWQLSALASGVEIVTYDGPISTVDKLWRLVADEKVNVFGTSPAYLGMCEAAHLKPGRSFDLGALRAVLSTGAVLHDSQFKWVRDHVKQLPLQSISGGTDILGCFVLGNPNLPVHAGEAQCKSLAMDVRALAQRSGAPAVSGVGELVCANPFPSRPLGFFGDADGAAFHAAYFSQNPGCWTHGDLIEFSPQGSARLHGRSDGVLNVRGINVSPGEIYRVLKDIPEISEAMLVEQRATPEHADHPAESSGQRIVLLLTLHDGAALSASLLARVLAEISRRLSAAHVPERVIAVDELPHTHNGKLSEAAARSAVNDLPISNISALRNPSCLEAIRNHPALHENARALPEAGNSREQLERHLQARWEQLFGFAPISLDDNFFELGGNSLTAARLLADVHQSTGRMLPLASMLVAPTVRLLARMIRQDGELPLQAAPVLVRAGEGRPVFYVHGIRGWAAECWQIAHAMKNRRPFYGLQAQGLDAVQPPQECAVEIAKNYVAQMRSVQPHGPYALVGYSFGGLIGLEMAQQLARIGEKVEVLCLLDTYIYAPVSRSTWIKYRGARALRQLASAPALQVPGIVGRRLVSAAKGVTGRIWHKLRRVRIGGMKPLSPIELVQQKLETAMRNYRPQPYGGQLVFIRSAVRFGQHYDPVPLWRQLATGDLEIVDVPGGHMDMLASTAHLVAAAIDDALKDEPKDAGKDAKGLAPE